MMPFCHGILSCYLLFFVLSLTVGCRPGQLLSCVFAAACSAIALVRCRPRELLSLQLLALLSLLLAVVPVSSCHVLALGSFAVLVSSCHVLAVLLRYRSGLLLPMLLALVVMSSPSCICGH